MAANPYPLFPVFTFLGFVLALVPMPWHLQAWNAGTCIYMMWASLASLIQFVDSIVWHGRVVNVAPIWCDISTKFLIGAGVGIPAASLCINRRLYKIASIQSVTISRQKKRRAVFVDMAIAIGIPVLVMILHVVVQGHRFNILEDVGCIPTIYNTPPAYPLVFMWPVLLGCISFVYAFLTLRSFWRRRVEFSSIISSSTSLTTSRYFRLMLLSCIEMSSTVPLGLYSIFINVGGVPIARWTSWADVHFNFGFVEIFPATVWKHNHQFFVAVEMGRWIYPCSAMVFFALFGFADEAQRNYRLAYNWILKTLRIRRSGGASRLESNKFLNESQPYSNASDGILPAYSPPRGYRKRTQSITSSLTTSFHDLDLEKGPSSSSLMLSPLSREKSALSFAQISPKSSEGPSEGETVVDSEFHCDPEIVISDEYPASSPPTPRLEAFYEPPADPTPLPVSYDPGFTPSSSHRPFSPPSVVPITSTQHRAAPSEGDPIVVIIHTESHSTVDL